jgi:hypothetical protein
VLSDPEENLDWRATFAIDLAQSRELNRPVLRLLGIGEGPLESLA